MSSREDRRHITSAKKDQRNAFEIDRDRVQYSSALHRLAGVTQIVRAGEAGVFHTRLQHTYKVAQLGRRLAQYCLVAFPSEADRLGLDPEVVEAAGLAHDLGHPPFGHAGEEELNKLVVEENDPNGFEGNAQTFRIITKLAVRYTDCLGLNLTRATLAATVKYPWLRDTNDDSRTKKWGAYDLDRDDFDFCRLGQSSSSKTLEASIMDWADDISYSVHDLEDFHRVGAIPWAQVFDDGDALVSNTLSKWFGAPTDAEDLLKSAFVRLEDLLKNGFGLILLVPYEGTREQRVGLRNLTSALIGRFVEATRLSEAGLDVNLANEAEVKLLKQIARDYITSSPTLIAQQHGQRKLIANIFAEILAHSNGGSPPKFLPHRLAYLWDLKGDSLARFACDCIASMTESEVVGIHGRLFGSAGGSVLDPIVR